MTAVSPSASKGAPAAVSGAAARVPADAKIEAYLSEVRNAMFGLSSKTKAGILEELREHLTDLTKETGSADAALGEMERPDKLALGFRVVYGFGPGFAALLGAAGVLLSLVSLPSLGWISFVGMIALFMHAVSVSVSGGKRLGALCGAAACASRVLAVAALWYLSPGAYALPGTAELALFAIGSAMLPVAGFMAGQTKERYEKGRPIEF